MNELVEQLSVLMLAETAYFEAKGKSEMEICKIEKKYSDIASRLLGIPVDIGVVRSQL